MQNIPPEKIAIYPPDPGAYYRELSVTYSGSVMEKI